MSEECKKYDVTVYVTMKVNVDGIHADSHYHAGKKASELIFKSGIIDRGEVILSSEEGLLNNVRYMDYADEISGYLVDVVGDSEYLESKTLDSDGYAYFSHTELKNHVLRLAQWIDLLQEVYGEIFTAVENGIDNDRFFQLREQFRNITSALETDTSKNVLDADQIESDIRLHFQERLEAELAENGLEEIARLIGRYSMMSPLQALASIRETETDSA